MEIKHDKINAFTLAEVLITLGIIGVIAAMTITTLFAEYQKRVYVIKLKKTYTMWNQALKQMAIDSGCPNDLSCFYNSSDKSVMGQKIVKYFRVTQDCDLSAGCWPTKMATKIDGSGSSTDSVDVYYKFTTIDNVSIQAAYSPSVGCVSSNGLLTKICDGQVRIDVNGLAPPNTWGRDIFWFAIINDNGPELYPFGGAKFLDWKGGSSCSYPYFNNASSKDGMACAGRIISESWEITY